MKRDDAGREVPSRPDSLDRRPVDECIDQIRDRFDRRHLLNEGSVRIFRIRIQFHVDIFGCDLTEKHWHG